MLDFLKDIFGPPDKIDPAKVMDIATSPHQKELADLANQQIKDPTGTAVYQSVANQKRQDTADAAFANNLINMRNVSQTGGNVNQASARQDSFMGDLYNNMSRDLTSFASTMYDKGTNLLQNVMGADMNVRQLGAQAHGQDVTNRNNWKAGMAASVADFAGQFIPTPQKAIDAIEAVGGLIDSDGRLKKNIVRIGHTKLSNGKTTGIYKFIWKHNNKKGHGFLAQDVEKVKPDAVVISNNGHKMINTKKL